MAIEILSEIQKSLPQKVTKLLQTETDPAILFLLQQAEDAVIDCKYLLALQSVEAVLECVWEDLNTRHWSDVPISPRQTYTAAVFVKINALIGKCEKERGDIAETLQVALKTADLGIMLGAPFSCEKYCITEVASLFSEAFLKFHAGPKSKNVHQSQDESVQRSDETEFISGVRGQLVPTLMKPSLEKFRTAHFVPCFPVKLVDCITHWPALNLWKDINYLKKVAGARTVPIELGVHYTHPDWSQKLMTLKEFIDLYVAPHSEENRLVGYLAQHSLFEQVPELLADIHEPEYCCLTNTLDEDITDGNIDINAWFGPKGTISPLHHDPKHNLLAQVVGEKRILLYHPEEADKLYPHEGSLLNNTAQVNPEEPDYKKYPQFENAVALECILKQGEMLYIPPKWWHHVRSLSTSFSVSFWWK